MRPPYFRSFWCLIPPDLAGYPERRILDRLALVAAALLSIAQDMLLIDFASSPHFRAAFVELVRFVVSTFECSKPLVAHLEPPAWSMLY